MSSVAKTTAKLILKIAVAVIAITLDLPKSK